MNRKAMFAAAAFVAQGAISGAVEPLKITAVQARLFLHHSGTLTAPLDGTERLWNAIIGEGSVPEPSTSTLVDVVVAGKHGEFDEKWSVELMATNSRTGKVVVTQSKDVGVLGKDGQYHVGFWLPRTGCIPLQLTARIAGTSVQKVAGIPFACGE